jgi:hypothetical protein
MDAANKENNYREEGERVAMHLLKSLFSQAVQKRSSEQVALLL